MTSVAADSAILDVRRRRPAIGERGEARVYHVAVERIRNVGKDDGREPKRGDPVLFCKRRAKAFPCKNNGKASAGTHLGVQR
jgi:hypothetical protein